MARLGTSATQIVMAMFVVALFYVSGGMAQDISPSPAIDTGAGFTLPVSVNSKFQDYDMPPFHSLVMIS
ncbi:hypothetical protein CRYUN_Cryun05aG0195400 [Craigia yunnanensis]